MSRELKIQTKELGAIQVYVVYETNGIWEEAWRTLQGAPITTFLSSVTKEVMDHALYGWSSPLAKALGLAPEWALRKVPQECHQRRTCIYYKPNECKPLHPSLPWCFEPEGTEDPEARRLSGEVVKMWKAGVWVVVVEEWTR